MTMSPRKYEKLVRRYTKQYQREKPQIIGIMPGTTEVRSMPADEHEYIQRRIRDYREATGA
jgi:hypothetical protein